MTTLVRELATGPTGRQILHNGGTITYCAYVGDRWVGWIGDGREWEGSSYGGRRWWCAWRQEGDEAARWGTGLEFTSRAAAVDTLTAAIIDNDVQP